MALLQLVDDRLHVRRASSTQPMRIFHGSAEAGCGRQRERERGSRRQCNLAHDPPRWIALVAAIMPEIGGATRELAGAYCTTMRGAACAPPAAPSPGRAELLPDALGDGAIDLGVRAVGIGDDDRVAAVGGLADGDVERHLAEEVAAELLGLAPRAAMAEDLAALAAMRAEEIAHVLDDAEHRHVDLAEHVEALARVEQRDVLRRRDDDRAGRAAPAAPW